MDDAFGYQILFHALQIIQHQAFNLPAGKKKNAIPLKLREIAFVAVQLLSENAQKQREKKKEKLRHQETMRVFPLQKTESLDVTLSVVPQ